MLLDAIRDADLIAEAEAARGSLGFEFKLMSLRSQTGRTRPAGCPAAR